MKKLLLAMAAILAIVSLSSYKVKGTVTGLSGKIYLAVMEGKTPRIIDSTEVKKDGKFTFDGDIAAPMFAVVQDEAKKGVVYLFLENSDITINGSMENSDKIAVVGSVENTLYKTVADSSAAATDYDAYQAFLARTVAANPKSYAAAYTFFRLMTPALDGEQIRKQAAAFDAEVQKSIYITLALEKAATLEKTAVGKHFIDFSAVDTLDNQIALSSVAGRGKWVLLDFWASWCGPCRAENPTVVKAFNEYKDRGFTVFGVSLDRKKADWARAIVKDELHWTNVSDLKFWNSEPAALYGVSSIPSNALIAPDGTIAARNLRGEDLLKFLSEKL